MNRGHAIQGLVVGVVALAGVVVIATHHDSTPSSSPPKFTPPAVFAATNDSLIQTVQAAITSDSTATKLDGVPGATCTDEIRCNITYTVQEPVDSDYDLELVLPTRQIWKTLFTDPRFQGGTITVDGPTTSIGGKKSTSDLYSLTCDRRAAQQIDWDNVDGDGLRQLCGYWPQVKGMPGTSSS